MDLNGNTVNKNQHTEDVAEDHHRLSTYIKNSIETVVINEKFIDYTIDVTDGAKKYDGVVSVILKITIIGMRRIDEQLKNDKLILIVKIPPANEKLKAFAMFQFKREIFVYNDILPAFVKFQKDKGVKESEGFFSFPKCYLAQYDEELNDAIIIMEDVRESNYNMENKMEPLQYENARIFIEKLGQLHAISFAMKHQCPTEFEKYKQLKDNIGRPETAEVLQPVIANTFIRALQSLDSHEHFAIRKFETLRHNIMKEIENCTIGSLAEPYAVLNHGDCCINNIMFKYENNMPKSISLLDWQATRYASPVLDLVYFLNICTDKLLRDEYYDTLILLYYKSLSEHCRRLGSEPNQVFPFTAMLQQFRLFGHFGLVMAIILVPALFEHYENTSNLNNNNDKNEFDKITQKHYDQLYRKRMSDIIKNHIDLGFL